MYFTPRIVLSKARVGCFRCVLVKNARSLSGLRLFFVSDMTTDPVGLKPLAGQAERSKGNRGVSIHGKETGGRLKM